ncbi:glutamate 5-kinase [Phycicoccus sp. CSK15P-2]|uniref:glutamate 5-kinase n=1 Tax=Phycicoccus sp. CSK15P-2 TaxID=2807627 RepID=UPI00194DC671|nr:glutamate 5-kinase [Phycicoccus sp. CSK15P-2]MBM6404672.1 glutamate 5-kinase [Phycicoccus sp. CSK15P-2]
MADDTAARLRRDLGAARRLVVKVGSSSLTSVDGGSLDLDALTALVDVLAERRASGRQVVLVSSGAIAAGIGPLGLARRPSDLATQQAAASVGQGALVAAYQAAFSGHGLTVGQVLLTADDTTRRSHYTNARRTLERLLELGIVPIVNENDTVATQEIRFGDNDRLAALVADLVGADGLVLLTDVDALHDGPPSRAGSRRVPFVAQPSDLDAVTIGGTGSSVGSGGMVTKVEAAGIVGSAGVPTLLTRLPDVRRALDGADLGTVFAPAAATRASRKRWLAHATTARGRLVLDDGAVEAVTVRRKSLLPAGIVEVTGSFAAGDAVDVCAADGTVIARGLVNFASGELPRLLGRSTYELARELGPEYEREVVHRDDLVVL